MAGSMYRVGDPSYPRFAAANQMGTAEGYNHQMVNAPMGFGMSGPGQDTGEPLPGLLNEQPHSSQGYGQFTARDIKQPQTGGILADNTGGTTDRTGWDRDDIFWRSMVNLSNNILAPNSFY